MKPGALIATLALGWTAVGLFAIELLIALVVLTGYSYTPINAYLLVVGLPLIITLLLAGTLIGIAKRSQVARILYTVVASLTVLLAIIGLVGGGRMQGLTVILTILHLILLVASVITSYLPGVSQWMAYGQPGGGYGYTGPQGGGYGQQPGPFAPQQTGWPAQAGYGAPAGQGSEPALRPCPHCAEPIRVEASKCRFCGSAVTPLG